MSEQTQRLPGRCGTCSHWKERPDFSTWGACALQGHLFTEKHPFFSFDELKVRLNVTRDIYGCPAHEPNTEGT